MAAAAGAPGAAAIIFICGKYRFAESTIFRYISKKVHYGEFYD